MVMEDGVSAYCVYSVKLIETCESSRDRALVAVMHEGGLRCEEARALSWEGR
jgi:site-specific recombinase XerC